MCTSSSCVRGPILRRIQFTRKLVGECPVVAIMAGCRVSDGDADVFWSLRDDSGVSDAMR